VITSESAGEATIAEASRHADVLVAGGAAVDLASVLRQLHDAGTRTVLTEGGPQTLGELAAAGLLDELCLTLAPTMGGDPLPVAVWPPSSGVRGFRLDSVGTEDDHLFLRYLQETP
jgi:riboflavin biosynthesis pyrimidine reductase